MFYWFLTKFPVQSSENMNSLRKVIVDEFKWLRSDFLRAIDEKPSGKESWYLKKNKVAFN